MVTAISLVCLPDGHQIKDHHTVQLFVNFENYGMGPPDVHAIDLHFGVQTFYIRCAVRIFKFAEVVEDMFPDLLRILFESVYDPPFNLNIHGYTPAILPFICRSYQEGKILPGSALSA